MKDLKQKLQDEGFSHVYEWGGVNQLGLSKWFVELLV